MSNPRPPDPTDGAKSHEAGLRPHDNVEQLPEGTDEDSDETFSREMQRAFEQSVVRLPPT